MKLEYKCPVCRAVNILDENNQICRRCKSDLYLVYEIKKKYNIKLLQHFIRAFYEKNTNSN